jgi:hypothetical protein
MKGMLHQVAMGPTQQQHAQQLAATAALHCLPLYQDLLTTRHLWVVSYRWVSQLSIGSAASCLVACTHFCNPGVFMCHLSHPACKSMPLIIVIVYVSGIRLLLLHGKIHQHAPIV